MFATRDIRVLYLFMFKKGLNAAAAANEINQVVGLGTCNERTVQRWFANFREGNFGLENEPRGPQGSSVDDDELRAEIERNTSTTLQCLAETFNVSKSTISRRLKAIGKVKKLDRWVPHELTEKNKLRRLEVASSLLMRHKVEPFLKRIVTCDEKWILYDNRKRSAQWLDRGAAPRQQARAELHPKKVMVTVWWTSEGIVHYSFLNPGETITSESYCVQLDEMYAKLRLKQPILVNRHGPIMLHDNARPHGSRLTMRKLQELQFEVLAHPPYSPDLSPTDYHLFRSLGNHLHDQRYTNQNAIISSFEEFLEQKNASFYKNGIFDLPTRWQRIIDVNGEYFDE